MSVLRYFSMAAYLEIPQMASEVKTSYRFYCVDFNPPPPIARIFLQLQRANILNQNKHTHIYITFTNINIHKQIVAKYRF